MTHRKSLNVVTSFALPIKLSVQEFGSFPYPTNRDIFLPSLVTVSSDLT